MKKAPEVHDLGALFDCVLAVMVRHGGSATSWWRSPMHNMKVGGVPDSMHLKGLAVDVVYDVEPPSMIEVTAIAGAHGCRVIREKNHDHFEVKT